METIINQYQTVQDLVAIEAKIASLTARKKEIHAQLKSYGKNFDVAGHGCTVEVRTTEKEVTTVCLKSYAASTTLALKGGV